MRHCLVCSLTVGALDFVAVSISIFGTPREFKSRVPGTTERRLTPEQRRRERPMKRLALYHRSRHRRQQTRSSFLNVKSPTSPPLGIGYGTSCLRQPQEALQTYFGAMRQSKLHCQNKLPAEVFGARGRSFAQNFVFEEKNFPLKFMFSTCVRGAEHLCVSSSRQQPTTTMRLNNKITSP
jgi:hypothetical protein